MLAVLAVATVTALLLAFQALAQRYGVLALAVLCALGGYFMLLAFAGARNLIGWTVLDAHFWSVAALVPLVTVAAFAGLLRERVLSARQAGVFLVICAGFAALYLESFRSSGILLDELPAALAALLLSSSLLPLAAVALAPWSLAKIRHG